MKSLNEGNFNQFIIRIWYLNNVCSSWVNLIYPNEDDPDSFKKKETVLVLAFENHLNTHLIVSSNCLVHRVIEH